MSCRTQRQQPVQQRAATVRPNPSLAFMAMAADIPAKAEAAKPFFDAAVWTAVPSIVWVFLIAGVIWWLRFELKSLLSALISRVKSGGPFKVGFVEIGPSSGMVAKPGDFSSEDTRVGVYVDKDGTRVAERDALYQSARDVMLVHRLQRSSQDRQLYDILIYVIPHKGASLAGVSKVEYFFGHYWGNKIFPSNDRSRGFPIVTSAYGPFLCTARVHFNDGSIVTLSRYLDFEMGGLTSPAHTRDEG